MDSLSRLSETAAVLVAQRLRSSAVVLRRARALLLEAHADGHSHRAIHQVLEAAGLVLAWNTYKSCLRRMNVVASHPPLKAAAPPTAASGRSVPGSPSLPCDLTPDGPATRVSDPDAEPVSGSGSPTRVMDALAAARAVPSSRDYAQIARDLHRQERRDQRTPHAQQTFPKDRP